jgi:DNA-binding transcriptional LysR family regulator
LPPFVRRSRDNPVTMKLSPRNLVHLIALAEEGRISRAAMRVHLSPSAFSRSIQSVEDDLGVQLFHRNMNGVTLTAAGQAVLGHARALDFENKRFELNLDLLRRGDFDRISIGAGPIPASILVPELIRAMHLQTPHLRIHVEFGDMSTLIARLDKNEIDICLGDIRYAAGHEERYASKKLAIVKTIVCCRIGHPLSSVGRVTSRDLLTHRLALARVNPSIERELHACFGLEASEKIPMVVECDDLTVLANLVATTDLIGILPPAVFEKHSESLSVLDPEDPSSLYGYVHAIWPKNRVLAPSAIKILDLARQIAQR